MTRRKFLPEFASGGAGNAANPSSSGAALESPCSWAPEFYPPRQPEPAGDTEWTPHPATVLKEMWKPDLNRSPPGRVRSIQNIL